MSYKVFLVEDEIITREGLRDSIDWRSAGYELCGEAPDGEMALPLIRERQPEAVITDIKMPFMDGLQLCRILRQTMPETRIIILSGHDEFRYAQEAMAIGVSEYLLKPVSPPELLAALRRTAAKIDDERQVHARLQEMRMQVADHRELLREHCLLNLVLGLATVADTLEQAQNLELDLIAPAYLPILVHVVPERPGTVVASHTAQRAIASLINTLPTAYRLKKDVEETVLLLKGLDTVQLTAEGQLLTTRLHAVLAEHDIRALISAGPAVSRLGDIAASFATAQAQFKSARMTPRTNEQAVHDLAAIAAFLRNGTRAELEGFVASYVQRVAHQDTAEQHQAIKADTIDAATRWLHEIGADSAQIISDNLHDTSRTSIQANMEHLLGRMLEYRDRQSHHQRMLATNAREYIDSHYADADISLSSVAAHVKLSPSYLSVVFSREFDKTFIEYLTSVRIQKAAELLRTTNLSSSEIAYRVGYHNPRYFFAVFRKATGATPTEFRRQL